MRIIFSACALVSILFASAVSAQNERRVDLAGYRKLLAGPAMPMTSRSCFAEHLCALGGPIGKKWNCDTRADVCIDSLARPDPRNDELQPRYACDTFFDELTKQQLDFLSAPAGCEAPPPPASLKTVFTMNESSCVKNIMCKDLGDFAARMSCEASYDRCAGPFDKLTAYKRSVCRQMRAAQIKLNLCPLSAAMPPWRNAAMQAASEQPSERSKTWREEVDRAKNSGIDEFSLGDLDFD